ncbi:MAG: ABC transporter substrate-binding protein [Betaproteobacteria bacterium]|nr:ABC transporter substrate-binding protein [Betaproteobacteria bacterium]
MAAVVRMACVLFMGLGSLAHAQPAPGVHKIGFVNVGPAVPNAKYLAALKAGFAELGYVEGKNLELIVRWGDGQPAKLPDAMKEILAAQPRLILSTGGGVTVKAAAQAAPNLPVVFITGNPLGEQLVSNLARPSGNLTGIAVLAGQLEAKRLELLKQLVPKVKRVGMVWNPSAVAIGDIVKDVEAAAKRLGIELVDVKARSPAELDAALADVAKAKVDALFVVSDPVLGFERKRIVDFAARQNLPGIYFWREFAEIGGLASYGASLPDVYKRLAFYADKILKGAKAGDLPIEQPTRFEFIINQKAAAQLKLSISAELLLRADEVIQ